ncbi:MAG: site-specific integrase [Sphingobacteriales bacterium JAD_PAG50586_3]|nr:MAG: site-specific integrase [Sphingobacteriales bacterium JAD_PAG50586_3]
MDKSKRNFQRAKETRQFPEYPEFNARLDNIETIAKNVFRQYMNDHDNGLLTVEKYTRLLNAKLRDIKPEQPLTLYKFIENFIEESKHRHNSKTGKSIAKSTICVYERTLRILREFEGEYYGRRIDFDTIDIEFYNDYVQYLTKVKKLAKNTIGNFVKTLKTFLNDAFERGYTTNTNFKNKRFLVIHEESFSIYLNTDELDILYKLRLSARPYLERARDLFIVGCWTGLRFSDFSNIGPENIQGEMFRIKTQKTGQDVVIPIHPTVKEIMKKYEGIYPNSLPPSISNAKMNKYLKIICEMIREFDKPIKTSITRAGFKEIDLKRMYELVVTHTARRSFATNLYKQKLPSLTIMAITGHKTEKAFMRYIKTSPSENAEILKKHWDKSELTASELNNN